MVTDDMLRDRV